MPEERGQKYGDADHTASGERLRMASGKGSCLGGGPTGHPQPRIQTGGSEEKPKPQFNERVGCRDAFRAFRK